MHIGRNLWDRPTRARRALYRTLDAFVVAANVTLGLALGGLLGGCYATVTL